jgi:hypothetical protein
MTVCIAATLLRDNTIAIVTDQLISDGFVSAEGFKKHFFLHYPDWIAVCEAKEARRVPRLIDAICQKLGSAGGMVSLESDVMEACTSAYRAEVERLCDARLSKLGFTLQTFRDEGQAKLGDGIFETVLNELKATNLGITLLVAGFGISAAPMLLEVSDGEVFESPLGFHAIGEGAWVAEAMLNQLPSNWLYDDPRFNIYRLCAAKFAAERTASGSVGRDTTVITVGVNSNLSYMDRDATAELRRVWEANLAARPPDEAVELIETRLLSINDRFRSL